MLRTYDLKVPVIATAEYCNKEYGLSFDRGNTE
jgi:hypothetical protein